MTKRELAKKIFEVSILKGEFRLRSGQISIEYFDKYLFESDPSLLRAIAEEMLQLVPTGVEGLAGLEMGGIPLVTMLSQVSGIPALVGYRRRTCAEDLFSENPVFSAIKPRHDRADNSYRLAQPSR